MQTDLDKANENYLEEKKKRRADVSMEVARRKAVESTVDKLYKFIDELHEEIAEARTKVQTVNKDIKSSNKFKCKANSVAQK